MERALSVMTLSFPSCCLQLAHYAQIFLLTIKVAYLEGVLLQGGPEPLGLCHEYNSVDVKRVRPTDDLAIRDLFEVEILIIKGSASKC